MAGIEVFLSYSHADEGHLAQLVKHLDLLRRQGLIKPWYDRQIEAGTNVHAEIESKLDSAQLFLLLVSPDFVFSDYCYEKEMEWAMKRHHDGSATVIPAILRPCDWHSAPFGTLLAVPRDGKPVTEHENRDRAYLEIAQAVRKAAKKTLSTSRLTSIIDPLDKAVSVPGKHPSTTLSDQESTKPGYSAGDVYNADLTIRKEFTDWQKEEFANEAFEIIAQYFEHALKQLQKEHAGSVRSTFRRVDATSFEATAYVHERERSRCGVWIGGEPTFSRNTTLGYNSGGVGNRNSFNEMLQIEDDGYRLYLRPVMGISWFHGGEAKHELAPNEAAQHLWRVFLQPMQ